MKKKGKALIRRVKKISDKLVHWSKCLNLKVFARKRYNWYREHCKIKEKWILLESLPGGEPQGNIEAVLRCLSESTEFREYRIFLAGRKGFRKERKKYLAGADCLHGVKQLTTETRAYYKVLASAKYLVTDDAFIYLFVKRPEQVYLNVWHGTPLMNMGKNKVKECAMIGNEQKNFLDADFLLCQNEFTMQSMTEDYMLANFGKTRLLLSGNPRNEVLLKTEQRDALKEKTGLKSGQNIVYMPTWRNFTKEVSKESYEERLNGFLQQWDRQLQDTQTVYVKQEYTNDVEISYERLVHIRPFPVGVATYEVLAAADVLVTDYASVLFDFALTGRKIILFDYDAPYYASVRGFHREPGTLPFPKAETVDALVKEINTPKNYEDAAFLQEFCAHDALGVTGALCRKLLFGEDSPLFEERELPYNGKPNILLYIGSFAKNGLTTSAVNLLRTVDRTKYNFAVAYYMLGMKKRQEDILVLPEDVARFGFYFHRSLTYTENALYMFWREFTRVPFGLVKGCTKRLAQREAQRMFSGLRLDTVIQFAGYDDEMTLTMSELPCNRVIFAHNDMEKEIKTRGNADRELLGYAYNTYDSVAVVTEDILPPAKRIAAGMQESGAAPANITVCNNIIDVNRIRTMGAEPLRYDESTVVYPSKIKLEEALASEKKVFVNVGRFSVEKGHGRLISAFEKLHREYPDTCLVIIGGHGDLWDTTKNRARKSACADSIFLVRHMSNPYPLMKQCDYFSFSSLYEGFGLVLVEADILGLPCFSPEIVGPSGFMKKYGGLLVENSTEGIVGGMRACMEGTVPKRLAIDYEEYNRETVSKFETLVNRRERT